MSIVIGRRRYYHDSLGSNPEGKRVAWVYKVLQDDSNEFKSLPTFFCYKSDEDELITKSINKKSLAILNVKHDNEMLAKYCNTLLKCKEKIEIYQVETPYYESLNNDPNSKLYLKEESELFYKNGWQNVFILLYLFYNNLIEDLNEN